MKKREIKIVRKRQKALKSKDADKIKSRSNSRSLSKSVEEWINDIRETKAQRDLVETRLFFGT